MGFTSIWHWIIVLLIVLLLFGAGKLPKVMGDLAKGINNFKAGLKDEEENAQPTPAAAAPMPLPNQAAAPTATPGAAPDVTSAGQPGTRKDEAARS